jgi:RimJ/RimL family protein N-acetyltransferase
VSAPVIRTERLLLRQWRAEDREPFAALNADARVMEFMPALLPRPQSDALARASEAHFATHGFGPWAVEVPGVAPFIGFVGLVVPAFEAHFTPAIEIGWRLAAEHWGQGYATEAALASARHAFAAVGADGLVSFTTPQNLRSRAVMRRIGMTHDPGDDFDHPRLAPGHRLRRHVLYRLTPGALPHSPSAPQSG